MKITHVTPNYFPSIGGMQAFFQNISERLVSQYDDQVNVLTTTALTSVHASKIKYLPAGDVMINGVSVHRFKFSRILLPFLKGLSVLNRRFPVPAAPYFQVLRNGPLSISMCQAVRNARAEIMLAGPFNYLHMYYPQPGRVPLVYVGALHIDQDETIHPMIIRAINRSNGYIAFTEYEKSILVRCGVEDRKIKVIGLGVDSPRFLQGNPALIRQRYGFGNDPVVAYFGRLASYKGVDTLIMAMKRVWHTHPKTKLLIAGRPTDFEPVLQNLLNTLAPDLRQKVVYIADSFSHEEAPDLFASCDIFVMVSRDESFGIGYLEAWASGKPVIAGNIGAVRSLVTHKVDGLLVECGDHLQVGGAIAHLLDNADLRASMGERGREKVRKHYTWDMVARNIRTMYEKVIAETQNGRLQ